MKNWFASILFLSGSMLFAQSGNNRIAIVDMNFILKKVPEYQEANKELQKRAAEWEMEIQKRKIEIKKQKDQLQVERPLLTSQLVEEKEEEIQLMESELLTYQQSKFGMDGDYFVQKINLAKPIQDKVFTLVNEYAEKKRYTMVLDKSDETKGMLYAKKGTDISDQIIRELEKTYRRTKLSKEEIAAIDAQEKQQEIKDRQRTKRDEMEERQRLVEEQGGVAEKAKETDPRQAEMEKRLAEIERKKQEARALRIKQIEERKAQMAQRREEVRLQREKMIKEAEERKEKARQERLARIEQAKQGASSGAATTNTESQIQDIKNKQEAAKKEADEKRKQQQAEKAKLIEAKKKEIQEAAERRRLEEEKRKASLIE